MKGSLCCDFTHETSLLTVYTANISYPIDTLSCIASQGDCEMDQPRGNKITQHDCRGKR